MKKFLSIILSLAIILTLVSCGKSSTDGEVTPPEQDITINTDENPVIDSATTEENDKDASLEKPKNDNATNTKPESKPNDNKPEVNKTEEKPTETPEKQPEVTQKTVGQTLLADFKAKAPSHSTASTLAEAISGNPVLPFSAVAMPIEPGLLSGFGNTEIKGFKEGAMFAPMIGSIPFIGYVFTLEDGVSVTSFISTLESNADLRWNICVEADEKISGYSGNKVFFVMCPKNFEEE